MPMHPTAQEIVDLVSAGSEMPEVTAESVGDTRAAFVRPARSVAS